MRVWLAGGALAWTVMVATDMPAQVRPTPTALQPASATASVAADSTPSAWQFEQCMGGLTYGAPLKWALSYGMGYVNEHPEHDVCVLGVARIGQGGAGLYTGIANAGMFGGGYAVTAGLLRTFRDPLNALARRTYVGASAHVWIVAGLGGAFGWYTRVGSDPAGSATPRSLLVWSTGFGF